ncbi:hypothetical protein ACLKA6_000832 [Drosophila palustris]
MFKSKPEVLCSFITEFDDHIFVTVDADAFFFLHDLITSYVTEKEKVLGAQSARAASPNLSQKANLKPYLTDDILKEKQGASIDLTYSEKLTNGSYKYEGTVIPPEQTGIYNYKILFEGTKITVEDHLRGCVCKIKPCIRYCCHRHRLDLNDESKCTKEFNDYPEYITLENGTQQERNIRDQFVVQPGIMIQCRKDFHLVPYTRNGDWKLFENGTLYRSNDDAYLSKRDYCLQPEELAIQGLNYRLWYRNCLRDFVFDYDHLLDNLDIDSNWKVGYAYYNCMFKSDDWSMFIYFFGPVTLMILINGILMISTIWHVHIENRKNRKQLEELGQPNIKSRMMFTFYLRLLITEIMNWLTELCLFIVNIPFDEIKFLFNILVKCHLFYCTLIFAITVTRKDVRKLLTRR